MRTMPVATVVLLATLGAQQSRSQMKWMTDVTAAERVAAKSNKPLLLVFR